MNPHLSNLSSIDSLTNGVAQNQRVTRKQRLERRVFSNTPVLKSRDQHDLCERISLAVCVQPEVLQPVTILIKAPLAGMVATHSRENVALMLSPTSRLTRIPSCRPGARCGRTFHTSAERPRARARRPREPLQSSSTPTNSWSRLVVEQLGLQNLVNIDFEWNQHVTGKPAFEPATLSTRSASKVAFPYDFRASGGALPARFCDKSGSRAELASGSRFRYRRATLLAE
jgi:hypothetical protein